MIARLFKWLLILAVIGGGYWAWQKYQPGVTKSTEITFRTNVLSRGDIEQSVNAEGSLTPMKVVEVGSQVSGIIKEMKVDFNSMVKQGDMMAKIDPATYERALARADAELASTVASLELAKFNSKRAQELYTTKLISETEFTQAKVALMQAEASVKIREASVETAKVDLERTTIYAPIEGMVISRSVEAGQTVAASFNTPRLFVIANDLRKMHIEAAVSEADIGGLGEGQPVTFLVTAYPNRQFKGTVKQVRFGGTTNQNVVTYTTVVEVDNSDLKLRPGMSATTTFITSQKKDVLRIPQAALRFRPPEGAKVGPMPTNELARMRGTNAAGGRARSATGGATAMADLPIPPWRAEGRQATDEERKKWMDSLTPEQREQYQQMRQRFQAGAQGGGAAAGGAGGSTRPAASTSSDGPTVRTVYTLNVSTNENGKTQTELKPVAIRTGIADGGSFIEILEGLNEGDVVVVGSSGGTPSASATTAAPGASPFGGSPFGGGGPPRRM